MAAGPDEAAVQAAVRGELALLDPAVRSSPEQAGALLHAGFSEVGASGRRWDRASVLAAMSGALSLAGQRVPVHDLAGTRLADDVVHLTYRTEHDGAVVRRSSIWRFSGERWQLWFHQGTPSPRADDPSPASITPTAAAGPAGE